jgi:hypothetical protein
MAPAMNEERPLMTGETLPSAAHHNGGNDKHQAKVLSFSSAPTESGGSGAVNIQYVAGIQRHEIDLPRAASYKSQMSQVVFETLEPPERHLLNEAFDRITDAADLSLTTSERSNNFDEWKDVLEAISRKVEHLTNNHRKILGSLISVVRHADLFEFLADSVRVFQDATNLLRQPRMAKSDSQRVIRNLLDRGLKISIPLSSDNLGESAIKRLEELLETVVQKSL